MKKTILIIVVLLIVGMGIYFLSASKKEDVNNQSGVNPEVKSAQTSENSSDLLIREDSYFVGPRDAQVVIVEFSDYECPACGYYSKDIEKVMEQYPDKVKVVFRNFPLSYHQDALPAALAAEAAGKQGRYFEMYKLLFAEQKLSEQDLVTYAKQLGLDMDQFNSDRKSQELTDKVNRDYQDGVASGLQGTPTFYLNGQEVQFNPTFDNWKSEIEKMSAK